MKDEIWLESTRHYKQSTEWKLQAVLRTMHKAQSGKGFEMLGVSPENHRRFLIFLLYASNPDNKPRVLHTHTDTRQKGLYIHYHMISDVN